MIISHSKQVNFWHIPRTGGSNVEMLLRLLAGLDPAQDVAAETYFYPVHMNYGSMPDNPISGALGPTRTHITPQTAIDAGVLTLAQYNTYQNYCIVRNPVDRFISMYHLAIPRYPFLPQVLFSTVVAESGDRATWRAQSEYLTLGNMTTLPFSDYVGSVNTILTAFGAAVPTQLPRVARNHLRFEAFIKQNVTAGQQATIEAYYAADMGLTT